MTFYVSRNPNDELMNQRTDTPDHKLLQYFLVTGGVNRNNNNLYHHRPSYTHCCIQLKLIYATADEAAAVPYMFYRWFFVFFVLFFRPQKWDNRSRERLNGFSWNFYQTILGKMEFATSCRRLANVDDFRNLRYDTGAITRGRHARRLRYKIMSARMDLILFI